MPISQLSLTDFRNLKSVTLDFDQRLNFINGDNGSGKTSLLEAVHVLCQARSFRTHQLKQCIRHGRSGFLLFGRFDNFKAGLARRDGQLEIRIDGEVVKRRSDLVRRVPINIVNADSFALIDGAPARRRAFLDWCMFHVEHEYAETWRRFQHALKQRNGLLRSRRDLKLLDYWDQHLIEPSLRLAELRASYSRKLQAIIDNELEDILDGIELKLRYRSGWPEGQTLETCLIEERQRDIRQGFTGNGVHRDDIEMTSDAVRVGEVLSRGQAKRVCLALFLAVLKLVDAELDGGVILLIDDLHSELDQQAQKQAYKQLQNLNLQLFISNIDTRVPPAIEAKEFKMFHVEHGIIKPRIFS